MGFNSVQFVTNQHDMGRYPHHETRIGPKLRVSPHFATERQSSVKRFFGMSDKLPFRGRVEHLQLESTGWQGTDGSRELGIAMPHCEHGTLVRLFTQLNSGIFAQK